nr:MAG TPA: hypothetical protein [Bacteriophage sp.]
MIYVWFLAFNVKNSYKRRLLYTASIFIVKHKANCIEF